MTSAAWLERIAQADVAATAATRTVIDAGGFRLLLNPADDFPGVNWAAPMASEASQLDPDAMIGAFQSHWRVARLEFLAEFHPGLPALLEAAGFRSEGVQDVMLVTEQTFSNASVADVRVQFLEANQPDTVFESYLTVQSRGFGYGGDAPPTPQQVKRWRDQVHAGRRAVLAFLEHRAVGVGTILRPANDTSDAELGELQGVTTLPDARRRGVALSLSSALVRDHLGRGGRAVWLSVENDAARACYARIGFEVIGSRLNYVLEG